MALAVAAVYLAGSRVRIFGAFEDETGDAADPDTAAFTIESPDGTSVTVTYPDDGEVVREAIGLFSVTDTYSTRGRWDYAVVGAGAVVAANDGSFVIRPLRFGGP